MVEVKRRIQNLPRRKRRVVVESVDRVPSTTLVSLADEVGALGILKDQRIAQRRRRIRRLKVEQLRHVFEIVAQRADGLSVDLPCNIAVADQHRVAFDYRLQRQSAIIVAGYSFKRGVDAKILVLQRV